MMLALIRVRDLLFFLGQVTLEHRLYIVLHLGYIGDDAIGHKGTIYKAVQLRELVTLIA